jgi:tRNA threonylcarbamoyladenosine biosynthesis protein TsaB
MLVLSADTSGQYGSIALAQGRPDGSCDVLELVPLAGGTFSAQLVPQISALLAHQGFGKRDIEGFTVASGPGSFTGLRVGLAAIKALAEVLRKPITAVSLLEALAGEAPPRGKVLTALDAGRGQVYLGEFEMGPPIHLLNQFLVTREKFLSAGHVFPVVTSDAAIADEARHAGLAVQQVERPQSDSIARLGWKKILSGEIVSPEMLEANYIRRSDAEIFATPNL